MFYFLLPSLVTYDFVLVIAAVVPAIFLMIQAYRSDRLETGYGRPLPHRDQKCKPTSRKGRHAGCNHD